MGPPPQSLQAFPAGQQPPFGPGSDVLKLWFPCALSSHSGKGLKSFLRNNQTPGAVPEEQLLLLPPSSPRRPRLRGAAPLLMESAARWETPRQGNEDVANEGANKVNQHKARRRAGAGEQRMLGGGTEGLRMSERAVGRIIIAGRKQKRVTIFLWMDSALMLLNSH